MQRVGRPLLLIAILASVAVSHAHVAGTTAGSFFYPAPLESGSIKSTFDMMFARVPYDVVEENQTYRWPLFSVRGLVGLPENFAVEASVSTNIVNWNIVAGPKWRYDFTDRLRAYLSADASFFYGNLNAGQIDQSATGWSGAPGLAVGYSFGDVSVTLKGELNYLFSLTGKTGELETERTSTLQNGWTISGFVEQPLWGDHYVIVGLRMNHVKFYYQTWLLAPTFDKFYYVPEAMLGIRL